MVHVSVDLKKSSDAVKNEVVKKGVYDKLVKKVKATQATDTNNLIKKADNNKNAATIENNIFDHNPDIYIYILLLKNLTQEINNRKLYSKISTNKISN